MTSQLDCSIGLKAETVYGTAVTVDRFYEAVSSPWDAHLEFVQGTGSRPGSRLARSGRRRPGKRSGSGTLNLEAATSGLGQLLQAALGVATSTIIPSSTAYQQVHTPLTSDPMPFYTVQVGTPPIGGGAVSPVTYKGAQCESIEFTAKLGEHVMINTEWTARDFDTAIAYATPSYPVNLDLLTFVDAAIYLNGTLTLPTTTAPASATGTPAANVSDFAVKWTNNLDSEGFNLGGNGARTRPAVLGLATLETTLTAEFMDNTLRDQWLAGTPGTLLITLQFPTAITSGVYPMLQLVMPVGYVEGETSKPNDGKAITQKFTHQGRDGLVAGSPLYVVYRTADTAI